MVCAGSGGGAVHRILDTDEVLAGPWLRIDCEYLEGQSKGSEASDGPAAASGKPIVCDRVPVAWSRTPLRTIRVGRISWPVGRVGGVCHALAGSVLVQPTAIDRAPAIPRGTRVSGRSVARIAMSTTGARLRLSAARVRGKRPSPVTWSLMNRTSRSIRATTTDGWDTNRGAPPALQCAMCGWLRADGHSAEEQFGDDLPSISWTTPPNCSSFGDRRSHAERSELFSVRTAP